MQQPTLVTFSEAQLVAVSDINAMWGLITGNSTAVTWAVIAFRRSLYTTGIRFPKVDTMIVIA